MGARRVLPFLLLVICLINSAFTIQNDWDKPNNIRRVHRISEYLVPPPPPSKFHPPNRLPRVADFQTTESPGWGGTLVRFMGLLNPFPDSSSQSSPPLLPPQLKTPYPPKLIQNSPLPPATTYNGPPPVNYEKPPLPPSSNDPSGYPTSIKAKSCNSCNKVPWMPMQNTNELPQGDAPYASPPLPPQGDAPYVPPPLPPQADALYAPPPLPPQADALYAPPPLPPQADALYAPPPLPSPLLELSPNDEYLHRTQKALRDSYHAASQEIRVLDFPFSAPLPYGMPVPHPVHMYPGAMPPLFKAVNFSHSEFISDKNHASSVFGNNVPTSSDAFLNVAKPTFNNGHNGQSVYSGPSGVGISQEPSYTNPSISDHQSSRVFHNGRPYDVTSSPGGFVYNASQTNQNIPSNYGNSGPDQEQYNSHKDYLSVSASVVESAPTPVYASDNPFIKNSIKFETSPLVDFTKENWHTFLTPSNSNAFTDSQRVETVRPTMAPGDQYFGVRQSIPSTESHPSSNRFKIPIDTATQEVLPTEEADDQWLDDFPSEHSTNREPKKWNKQVQVIIPYTSQHTPLPFHSLQSSHEMKISDTNESSHDNYVAEASNIKTEVVSPPNSLHIQSQPTTLPMTKATTRKPINIKKNVIDGLRLQKNIDNWTIQEYSKGTTVSTVSPSSDKLYLFPSKQIPDTYLTTTDDPVDHVTNSHYNNVKTVTLGGFSFVDQEHKSSTSKHVEGAQVQVKKIEKPSIESLTDASITSEKDMWQNFPVGISSVNRERVYIVTPQPSITTPRSNSEYRKEKMEEIERDRKELKETSQTDTRRTKKSDTFESIEKAYQVLPQAVNNLAVASTGPESVHLWGIMDHEDFVSSDGEYDTNDTDPPTYPKLSKESRARR